jgi:hypothetical protein
MEMDGERRRRKKDGMGKGLRKVMRRKEERERQLGR